MKFLLEEGNAQSLPPNSDFLININENKNRFIISLRPNFIYKYNFKKE